MDGLGGICPILLTTSYGFAITSRAASSVSPVRTSPFTPASSLRIFEISGAFFAEALISTALGLAQVEFTRFPSVGLTSLGLITNPRSLASIAALMLGWFVGDFGIGVLTFGVIALFIPYKAAATGIACSPIDSPTRRPLSPPTFSPIKPPACLVASIPFSNG